MRQFTGRQIGGFFVSLIGVGIIGSGLLQNPWVARITSGPSATDRLDVLFGYFVWSLVLGVAVIAAGSVFAKSPKLDGVLMLGLIVVAVVLADRYLLAKFGLPLWEHDPVLRYRHRPNIVRNVDPLNPSAGVYVINAYGQHDDDFPEEKPQDELRGLILGDSVTMGYGVTKDATFSSQLEGILAKRDPSHVRHQIINTGVHGYSTSQELVVLRDSLRFDPDFIALGFCMNDVTEPFVVDAELGGTGLDYHAVSQTPSPVVGWVLNETGFGRLVQRLQARGKTLQEEKLKEIFDIRGMAIGSRTEPRFVEAWALVDASLEKIYAVAKEQKKPFVLMVFPFTFQLLGDDALRTPQALLVEHARAHDVDVIDFTPIFRDAIYDDPTLLQTMHDRGYDADTIERFYAWKIAEYFHDEDHFTAKGNRLVAERLHTWLMSEGLATKTATVAGVTPGR